MAFYENELHKLHLRLAAIEGHDTLDNKLKPHPSVEQHADASLKAEVQPAAPAVIERSDDNVDQGPIAGNAGVEQKLDEPAHNETDESIEKGELPGEKVN